MPASGPDAQAPGVLSAHQPSQASFLFLRACSVDLCSHALIHSADAVGNCYVPGIWLPRSEQERASTLWELKPPTGDTVSEWCGKGGYNCRGGVECGDLVHGVSWGRLPGEGGVGRDKVSLPTQDTRRHGVTAEGLDITYLSSPTKQMGTTKEARGRDHELCTSKDGKGSRLLVYLKVMILTTCK